jgi:HEAT repeat protein
VNYGYVWIVIGGAQIIFVTLVLTMWGIRRSRYQSRIGERLDETADRATVHRWGASRFWWWRMLAARHLAQMATADDRALIARLLLDPHPGVQSAATAILARYADESLVASIIDTLVTRSAAVRMYQSKVLRRHRTLAEPLVLQRLRADAPPSRLYSYIGLAQTLGTRACIDRVAALSIHQNPDVRVAVARALHLARPISAAASNATEADDSVASDPATIKLLTMLRDTDWRVRAQAARGLGAIGEPRVISELANALTDPIWWVRFRAGLALATFGERGRHALEEAFTGTDRYARDMAAFVYALSPSSVAELSDE